MCGIVGLFLKDKSLEPKLGEMLTEMLITMTDRGPDSAGIAVYGADHDGRAKLTIQSPPLRPAMPGLKKTVGPYRCRGLTPGERYPCGHRPA